MLKVDFHIHSIRSLCGIHTLLEIVNIAKEKKMRMICIADHSRPGSSAGIFPNISGTKLSEIFLNFGVFVDKKRVPDVIDGIKVLRGIECNIEPDGSIDCPTSYIFDFDLICVGFHSNFPKNMGIEYNTEAMLKCIERSPIDIITHPAIKDYPVAIEKVMHAAHEKGIAMELNNTNMRFEKDRKEAIVQIIKIAENFQIPIVTNSDGHTQWEIGEDEEIEKTIKETSFDKSLIINNSLDEAKAFVKARKSLRQKYKPK